MKLIELTADTLEMREQMVQQYKDSQLLTGIEAIDKTFTFLCPNSIYAICAGTGVGKTTLLLATAKKLANAGKKVLYLSIEMNLAQLLQYCPGVIDNLSVTEFDDNWQEVANYLQDHTVDFIVYDYLGAFSGDYIELQKQTESLADWLRDLKQPIVMFTALQANNGLITTYEDNKEDPLLWTNAFIAGAKGIARRLGGGAYLIDNKLYNFKNRYADKQLKPIYLIDSLDYSTKTWKNLPTRPPLKYDYGSRPNR